MRRKFPKTLDRKWNGGFKGHGRKSGLEHVDDLRSAMTQRTKTALEIFGEAFALVCGNVLAVKDLRPILRDWLERWENAESDTGIDKYDFFHTLRMVLCWLVTRSIGKTKAVWLQFA